MEVAMMWYQVWWWYVNKPHSIIILAGRIPQHWELNFKVLLLWHYLEIIFAICFWHLANVLGTLADDKNNGTFVQIQPDYNAQIEAVTLFFRKDVKNLKTINVLQ